MIKPSIIIFLLGIISKCLAYDLSFNTDKDINMWKFNGSYLYSRTLQDIAPLVPASIVKPAKETPRPGLWLSRYSGPEADNFLVLEYSLHHHLLVQGVVEFIASPNVPLLVTSNENEVGKFWSDGKTWCHAVFNVNMFTKVKIDISTPNSGDYFLLDKIILGVMGNLTYLNGREIQPCLTSPSDVEDADLVAPEVNPSPPNRRSYQQPTPPDMAVKQPYRGGIPVQGLPDMRQDRRPRINTRTQTDNEVEENDSDVKCGCSCSCSRPKSRKAANATMTVTG